MSTTAITKAEFYKQEYKRLCDADVPVDPQHFKVARRFRELNRYSNVLPNEPTRVKFQKSSKYINANWMLDGAAIASQGPKDEDLQNFFYMLRKRNVEVVVSLVNPIEQGKSKCYDYWSGYKGEILYENGEERVVKREIPIKGKLPITHFHLENWPDFQVVKPETLAFLVQKVHEASKGKIFLVHCSAGIGRTGSFLAILDAFRKESGDVFKIAKAIRHPETGRVGSIQNAKQYGLIYETLDLLMHFS